MANAHITFIVFFNPCAGRNDSQAARPAKRQVVIRKIGGIAKVGIPAFPRTDEQDTIAGIFNDVAVVSKRQGKLGTLPRRFRRIVSGTPDGDTR